MAKKKQPKKKLGRPPKIVSDDKTLHTIRGLGRINCTIEEAAAVLGCHRDTFGDFLRRDKKGLEAWETGHLECRVSLRRTQFNLAQTNAGMAIFLGKNLLGQRDQIVQEHTGKVDINLDEVRGAIASKLSRIAAAIEANGVSKQAH
jgi:hypothetical protein